MINLLLGIMFWDNFLHMVKYIPWTQGMCNEVVHIEPRSFAFVSDRFKTQIMCNEAVKVDSHTLKFVPVYLRTAGMCERDIEKYLHPMRDVPDNFKTQETPIQLTNRKRLWIWKIECIF